MKKSIAGKVFTIYSIFICASAIWLFAPALPFAPFNVSAILLASILVLVLSIISLIRLFKKTNTEKLLMLIAFITYCISIVVLTIVLAINLNFFESAPILVFFIIPIISGIIYLRSK